MDEQETGHHWSDTLRNIAIASVQVATLLLIAEHAGWRIGDRLREARNRYTRWLRDQEFELYWRYLWKPKEDDVDDSRGPW